MKILLLTVFCVMIVLVVMAGIATFVNSMIMKSKSIKYLNKNNINNNAETPTYEMPKGSLVRTQDLDCGILLIQMVYDAQYDGTMLDCSILEDMGIAAMTICIKKSLRQTLWDRGYTPAAIGNGEMYQEFMKQVHEQSDKIQVVHNQKIRFYEFDGGQVLWEVITL